MAGSQTADSKMAAAQREMQGGGADVIPNEEQLRYYAGLGITRVSVFYGDRSVIIA